MQCEVRLMVFCGRPNPVWWITSESHPELCEELLCTPRNLESRGRRQYQGLA